MSTEGPARAPLSDDEQQFELTVRPTRLADYIGQRQVKENLRVYMKAALNRREALDHVAANRSARAGQDDAREHHRP